METPPDTESTPAAIRRPACDNCKSRKTKCDRKSPCSGCVALQVTCQTTKKSPERRQRVLISDKYTEAIRDVNSKLEGIAAGLNSLSERQDSTQSSQLSRLQEHATTNFLRPQKNESLDSSSSLGTHRGESSFEAHARRLRVALCDLHGIERSSTFNGNFQASSNKSPNIAPQPDNPGTRPSNNANQNEPSLPPSTVTLNILHLIKVEQQRFFIDVPVITEDELTEACQHVYFPAKGYSFAAWATANVGLYFLLHDLQPDHYSAIGLTTSAIDRYLQLLTRNVSDTGDTLQLCVNPTFESCQALALLGMFWLKSGHIESAWRLVTSAVRMCMDLGMHRIFELGPAEEMKRHSVFWWLYATHQSLALTLGRSPAVRKVDAETRPGHFGIKRHAGHDRLYSMFIEFPSIIESINEQLFSVAAKRIGLEERQSRAQALKIDLLRVQEGLKQANRNEPAREMMFLYAAIMLEIILHSLLALVQYPHHTFQPLHFSNGCLESSRRAIEALVEVGKLSFETRPTAWSKLLSMTLSMTPFVPLLVLTGNAISTSSTTDVGLLKDALQVVQPVAADSPYVRCMVRECEALFRMITVYLD